MVAVSKRENFTAVWEALSTYEKAAIRKLALGLDWEIPETVRRRLRAFGVIENGPDTRLTDAGWKLHRANPRRKPGAKRAPKLLIANPEEVKEA
jgi:hypothetical protein